MPAWLLVLLVVVATHRLTRLAVADEIPLVKVPRDAAVNWLDPTTPGARAPWGGFGRSVAYLLGCPWCMSIWVGGVLVWLTAVMVGLPAPWLVWLAASSVTGWAASAESEHEQRYELNEQAMTRGRAEAARQ
jgi:uncharacterized protein DUF1360